MIIVRRITDTKDGNVDLSLAMSNEQAQYIMSVGLATLVASGAAVIQDMTRAQFDAETTQQQAVEENVPEPAVEVPADEDSPTRH